VNCVRVMAADILNVFRRLARPFIIWLAIVAAPAYVVLYPRKDWWIFPSAFFLVFALYWLRAKVRLYFGLVEFLFGAYVFATSIQKGRGAFSPDFSADFARFDINLIIVTAFTAGYIMIRGLDNIETGLRIEGCDLKITKR
jgi:hypothetical protein